MLVFYVCSIIDMMFFFFKQKTAYEMRISDWSSDVCSSDLLLNPRLTRGDFSCACGRTSFEAIIGVRVSATNADSATAPASATDSSRNRRPVLPSMKPTGRNTARSEEHTSELQSLMRISYAVFCLKKKNTDNNKQQHPTQ